MFSKRNEHADTKLYNAIKNDDFDKVKEALEEGADPNKGREGLYFLAACSRGNKKHPFQRHVSMLLERN